MNRYKWMLIRTHLILLALLTIDIFLINLRGVWLDRLLVVSFLLTASLTFALYRKTLRLWQKLYFGFFILYPAFAALAFLMDRIFFAVVASPLIISLIIPKTRFSNEVYELREPVGLLAPNQLRLIKKSFITETSLGNSGEDAVFLDISSIRITREAKDTTDAIITSNGNTYSATFIK